MIINFIFNFKKIEINNIYYLKIYIITKTQMGEILFYGNNNKYGEFSNFYPCEITIDDISYPTTEHYFQAMKYIDNDEYFEKIRSASTPGKAAIMGRNRKIPIRKDWEKVKNKIMRKAIRAKFSQNKKLRKALVKTEGFKLIEHTKNDSYWGDGGDGTGKNMLGKILVKIRKEIMDGKLDLLV
jgi:N-glycosidase YbiA